jgi:hypothetical protein
MNDLTKTKISAWEKFIPWFLTTTCTLTLIAIALFLVLNIEWFKSNAFAGVGNADANYNIYAYQMYLAMIKGSIGLFSGFALMFLGTGVAFYSLKNLTRLNMESKGLRMSLVTASPGIIAMVLGAVMVMFTIGSKNEFPPYSETQHIQVPTKAP